MRGTIVLLFLTAFLAGCASDDPDADDPSPDGKHPDETSTPGEGFAPQTGRAAGNSEDMSLVIHLKQEGCGAPYCIDAAVTNEGSEDLHASAICASPWHDRMSQDGEPVQHRAPMAVCLAFGTEPFPPGATLSNNFTWDGQVYNDEADEMEPAPQGAYQWTIIFQAYENAGGEGHQQVDATLTVINGPT